MTLRMGTHDPAERVTVPTVDDERQHYIERGEMRPSPGLARTRWRMAIRVAFYSGMRLSEILKARVRNDCWVLVDTKNGSPRVVPIHPRLAVCARKFTPIPKSTLQRAWQVARKAAGYESTHFHDLRHSAASAMINADVDLYTVGQVLGHKDSRSTRYSHLSVGALTAAVGKIGKGKNLPTPCKRKRPELLIL